jgi:hypothetical protein
VALVSATNLDSPEMEPWRFALARIAFEGVDTETWAPLNLEQQDPGASQDGG